MYIILRDKQRISNWLTNYQRWINETGFKDKHILFVLYMHELSKLLNAMKHPNRIFKK